MADRFVVLAGGNFSATGTWSATDGGAGGASVPTSADNACMSNQSGNLVVDVTSVCLDFDQTRGTGYTGTLSGAGQLTVSGNIKMKGTNSWTGGLVLAGTPGKTIQSGGVHFASVVSVSGTCDYTLLDAFFTTANITVQNTATFNSGGFSITCANFVNSVGTPSITLGASTVTCVQWNILAGVTLSAASSTINATSTFNGAGKTYGTVSCTSNNAINGFSGNNSFTNLTLAPAAGTNKASGFSLSGDQTITGTFKYAGFSQTSRVQIISNVPGTTRTITAAAIDAASDFVIFADIAGAGASAPFATGTQIGNALGNSGITFTASATQTATGTASFTWSTHAWSGAPSRVPLPQDDVNVPNAFIAGRVITVDMPHIGRNVVFSCTGNPTYTPSTPTTITGSLTLAAGMVSSSNQACHLAGRGSHTLTCAGTNFIMPTFFDGPGGTWNLQDALNLQTSNSIAMSVSLGSGTLNTNDFTVTLNCTTTSVIAFRLNSGTLNMGASLFLFPSAGRWDYVGGTVNAGTSLIKYTDTSVTAKIFAGNGKTYNNFWFNGTGTLQLIGSSTFNQFKADVGTPLQFTAATTTTAADWRFGSGCSISSITAANHSLVAPGYVEVLGATVTNSTVAGGTFVDADGTNGGSNVSWLFGTSSSAAGSSTGSAAASASAGSVLGAAAIAAGLANVTGVGGLVSPHIVDTPLVGVDFTPAVILGLNDLIPNLVGHDIAFATITGAAQQSSALTGQDLVPATIVGVG